MKVFPLLRLVVVVCTTALFAQDAVPANPAPKDCQPADTTSAMRTCENARYQDAQRDLNSVYQSLLSRVDDAQKQKLRVAQRAWLQFRERNAEFMASLAQGGTLAPLIRIGSLTEMTKQRAAELKKVAH